MLNTNLATEDPEIFQLVESEKRRQFVGLELIASEVRLFPLSSVQLSCVFCVSFRKHACIYVHVSMFRLTNPVMRAELYLAGCDGGQRHLPHEQVL